MAVVLDDAGDKPEDDVLDRMQLARTVFALIKAAPDDWTLRIGIYGRWGEGKSTVLNFIERLARSQGMAVAKFNPSLAADSSQLSNDFLLAVYGALDLPDASPAFSRLRAMVSSNLATVLKAGQEIPEATTKAFFKVAELATESLQRKLAITQNEVGRLVRLSGKRLIVFVDDIDRLEPGLVPKLLLAVRQLDIPMTTFIAAIDPDVVTKGLSQVHGGWRDSPEFLEKILQFHYWLPPPDDAAIRRLIRAQATGTRLNIPVDVLDSLSDDCPRNPRRLKDFFRSLWQLAPIIERHREEDVDWSLIILLELMRAESPLLVDELLRSKSFREAVASSMFFAKTSDRKYADKIDADIKAEFDRLAGEQTLAPERRKRVDRIIRRIGDLALVTADTIAYWANVKHSPPAVTANEASRLLTQWLELPTAERAEQLIREYAARVDVAVSLFTRELFSQLIVVRQEHLSAASNSDVLSDLTSATEGAASSLRLLQTLIGELHIISEQRFGVIERDVLALYNHFETWAHFGNAPEYAIARKEERQLLAVVASESARMAAELLNHFAIWDKFSATGIGDESQRLRERFVDDLLPVVIDDVQKRFERPEGIASMKTSDGWNIRQYLLVAPHAGLYTAPFLTRLKSLAVRARTETTVQKNFIVAFRRVGYALKESGAANSPEGAARLETSAKIVGILWEGAAAAPLQPRLRGSLEELREGVESRTAPYGVTLTLPVWWEELKNAEPTPPSRDEVR
jgi:hypothetical protein